MKPQRSSMFSAEILRQAILAIVGQARPARAGPQPGDVRRRGRRRYHDRRLADPALRRQSARRRRRAGVVHVHGAVWLWLTVVFANLAEALAEGRGKAQADALRSMRSETVRARCATASTRAASELHRGDVVVVEAGEVIPGDGTVIEGIATVDESAITGESAPVIRESGGDRSAVTGGTRVLSDRDRRRDHPGARPVVPRPHDRARRGRRAAQDAERDRAEHPARRADDRLPGRRRHAAAVRALRRHSEISLTTLIALLVALIPTTIGALLSGDRHRRHGPPRASQRTRALRTGGRGLRRRRRAAARQDGHDHARQPPGVGVRSDAWRLGGRARRGRAAQSRWPTRRPRAARSSCSPSNTGCASASWPRTRPTFVPFTAQTRMSGIDYDGIAAAQGRRRTRSSPGPRRGRPGPDRDERRRRAHRARGRHAARRRPRQPDPRRRLPQGHRQGGHGARASTSCGRWASGP